MLSLSVKEGTKGGPVGPISQVGLFWGSFSFSNVLLCFMGSLPSNLCPKNLYETHLNGFTPKLVFKALLEAHSSRYLPHLLHEAGLSTKQLLAVPSFLLCFTASTPSCGSVCPLLATPLPPSCTEALHPVQVWYAGRVVA